MILCSEFAEDFGLILRVKITQFGGVFEELDSIQQTGESILSATI